MDRIQRQNAIKFMHGAMRNLQMGYPIMAHDSLLAALHIMEVLIEDLPDYSILKQPIKKAYRASRNYKDLDVPLTTSRLIIYAIQELNKNSIGANNACGYIWTALCQINASLNNFKIPIMESSQKTSKPYAQCA